MAQELTIAWSLSGEKSGLKFGPWSESFTRDVTERDKDEGTLDLNTSAVDAQGTNIPINAALSAVKILIVRNLDAVNSCTIGTRVSSNYVSSFEIKPGERWAIPITWAKADIYGQGVGGAVPIAYEALPG